MAHEVGPIGSAGPGTTYLRSELGDLKIIGVEEHCSFPALLTSIPNDSHIKRCFSQLVQNPGLAYAKGRHGAGAQRVKDMDEGGITFQLLSSGVIGCMFVDGAEESLKVAIAINDELKKSVDFAPTRFAALAELPMQEPELAIKELRRCVTELGFVGAMMQGSIRGTGKFLDDPEYDSILSAFEELDVPLYLHPGVCPEPVMDTYYTFPNPMLSSTFAHMGWGWHNEVAIHVIRLAVSGALDRHPRLKLVMGHQGEMVPMMMQRLDSFFPPKAFGYKRTVGQMLREQVWVAISGLFSLPPTMIAIATWGVDRVLFANDYPFVETQRVPEYIRALGDMVAPSDLRKICQTNTEELFKIKM